GFGVARSSPRLRVITATNVNLIMAVEKGKFREDLYYRLNTVPIFVPPLRERGEDMLLLFRKFTGDFSEKYHVKPITLDVAAQEVLLRYPFPGNIRQLKNIAEQVSLLEETREVDALTLSRYLPEATTRLPLAFKGGASESMDFSERDILYKVLFDMKKDMNELKKLILESYQSGGINSSLMQKHQGLFEDMDANIVPKEVPETQSQFTMPLMLESKSEEASLDQDYEEDVIEDILHEEDDNSLSLERKEKEMILKALRKHNNKRKYAANDLGISERTLYRKIKQYDIE
ncbi:MAG: helix-turn-helix domain-containing protein, partial [Algoriphagus sp.]